MFLMSDTTNFKRRTKVKSFIRKGKVVRSYDRSIKDRIKDALVGGAIGVTGTALLGGAYLLGKRNGVNLGSQSLDEVRSLIKNIKPEVTVNVPTPIVNVTNTPSIVKEVTNKTVDAVKSDVIKLDITKVPLPSKVNNLSKLTIDKITNEASKLDDSKLENTINLLSNKLKKYNVSNEELVKLDNLVTNLQTLKLNKFNKPSEKEYVRKQIIKYRDYFKLPKLDPEDLNVESVVDKEYSNKLVKVINRNKSILDIYQAELTKRKSPRNISIPTDDDINRLNGLLDDFNSSHKLALFNDVKSRQPIFLTDTSISKLSKLLW